MIIVQLTDTHIKAGGRLSYGKVDTAGNLERCVAHLATLRPRPDVALFTGDLVDFGKPDEYAEIRRILEPLDIPLYVIPGNHDDRQALREAFADHAYLQTDDPFIQYVVDDYPLRLIGLDTTIPGAHEGILCDARLAWLDERLAEAPDRPTALFMHHPPFVTGIWNMDVQRCGNGDELGRLVERHPQVQRILCGHVHRPVHLHWHGTTASIAPSPSHAVTYDLREGVPHGFTLEPPMCEVHYWREDTGLISHVVSVGRFDGPYPFFDKDGRLID